MLYQASLPSTSQDKLPYRHEEQDEPLPKHEEQDKTPPKHKEQDELPPKRKDQSSLVRSDRPHDALILPPLTFENLSIAIEHAATSFLPENSENKPLPRHEQQVDVDQPDAYQDTIVLSPLIFENLPFVFDDEHSSSSPVVLEKELPLKNQVKDVGVETRQSEVVQSQSTLAHKFSRIAIDLTKDDGVETHKPETLQSRSTLPHEVLPLVIDLTKDVSIGTRQSEIIKPQPTLPHELLPMVIEYATIALAKDVQSTGSRGYINPEKVVFLARKHAILSLTLVCKDAAKTVGRTLRPLIHEAVKEMEQSMMHFTRMRSSGMSTCPSNKLCPNCADTEKQANNSYHRIQALELIDRAVKRAQKKRVKFMVHKN